MDNLVFLNEIKENSKSVDKVHLHWVVSDDGVPRDMYLPSCLF